ncbi:3265_t:CDS:10 [Ambispora leptoticha]|uniref:3265_t:CDS:1 n=1 Tax=Ambispora leptoticha TaxID=144679 RepID=A0A9N8YSI6_9GLOM|nr:3265_t:CDS:10 [Ambispora leptoticha]
MANFNSRTLLQPIAAFSMAVLLGIKEKIKVPTVKKPPSNHDDLQPFQCTITFTNPFPAADKNSNASTITGTRYSNELGPPPPLPPPPPKFANGFSAHHNGSKIDPKHPIKKSIQKQAQNGKPLSVIVENPSTQNSLAGDLGDSGIFGFRNLVKRSASLTAIASSTFSLLTGIDSGPASPTFPPSTASTTISSQNSTATRTEKVEMEIIYDPQRQDIKAPSHLENYSDTDTETDDDFGFINLRKADGAGSDTMSVDLDTRESTPRSSVDFYGLGNNSERNWAGGGNGGNGFYGGGDNKGQHQQNKRYSTMSKCNSSPSLTQKYETLLWSFAQVVGHFIVDGSLVKSVEFEPLKHKAMYRPASGGGVGAGGAVGGGMLGIFGPNSKNQMNTGDFQERADNKTVPVFSTPPSILFVDLHLAPGETRTYTYETKLPNDLPPTHRGKAIRFHYNLIIGTHRGGMNHQSHIVQLPFRVFNHVSEDGTRPVYDLMNPLIIYKDEAIITCMEDKQPLPKPVKKKKDKRRAEFLEYVEKLVEASKNERETKTSSNSHHDLKSSEQEAISDRPPQPPLSQHHIILENQQKSCANTISILAKNMRKANYDICKNNERVAQLCLLKTSYRLGDVVNGVISFVNFVIPSYQVSITLENSELVEPTIANRPQHQISRLTRKIHGEHHEFCLNSRRISFSITIPTSSTPDFATTGVKLQWGLRLEFITGPKNKPPLLAFNADDRHQYYQAVSEVNVETFDCFIPIKVYPTLYESARTFSSQHTFTVS